MEILKIAFSEQGNMANYFREYGTSLEGVFCEVALHASRQCLISYYMIITGNGYSVLLFLDYRKSLSQKSSKEDYKTLF